MAQKLGGQVKREGGGRKGGKGGEREREGERDDICTVRISGEM